MKQIFSLLTSIIILTAPFLPQAMYAQESDRSYDKEYHLLAPLPGMESVPANDGLLNNYFSNIYQIGVSLVILLAVAVLIWGGIQYMTTDSFTKKGEARDTIVAAVVGILLAVGSYAIIFLLIGERGVELDLSKVAGVEPREQVEPGSCILTVKPYWGFWRKDDQPFCLGGILGDRRVGRGGDFLVKKDEVPEILGRLKEDYICRGESFMGFGLFEQPYKVYPSLECADQGAVSIDIEPDNTPDGPEVKICHEDAVMVAANIDAFNPNSFEFIARHETAAADEDYTLTIREYGYDPEGGSLTSYPGSEQVKIISGSVLRGDGDTAAYEGNVVLNHFSGFNENLPGVAHFVLKDSSCHVVHEYFIGAGNHPTNCIDDLS